jgi:uncharacterized membrane protein YadS
VPSYGTYNFSSFPWFAVLFIACIGINSLGIIPKQAVSVINSLDIFMLTMAMCALGMETSLEKVRMVGPKPFLLAAHRRRLFRDPVHPLPQLLTRTGKASDFWGSVH